MTYTLKFNHGDRVLVLDWKGNIEARGTMVGRHDTRSGPHYDVQPLDELSLSKRLVGLPESRIMLLGKPYLAFNAEKQSAV